ncbi:MAG: TIGR00701 family protein [Legionella sp.]|nr:MAG: TIGR00701 family protein [Legionella sp.]PJD98938.1 MAG: TIGR00701 family protein [Legionella sp.]
MLYVKAFHLVSLVAWFAGLFYLPRLFVYHTTATDELSLDRFKIMERRLYYGIMWPAALATSVLGAWLLGFNASYYLHAGWMHVKLTLVGILWLYHWLCGYYLQCFARNVSSRSENFFRVFNEVPTLLLVGIVLLVVVKPF